MTDDNNVNIPSAQESPRSTRAQPFPLKKRLLRAAPSFCLLIFLVVLFGRLGILHKLETTVSDAAMRLGDSPAESVAIVNVDDTSYEDIFQGTSPLKPERLYELIDHIAIGKPAVIGVDVDTSSVQFRERFPASNWKCQIVWEREVKEAAAAPSEYEKVEPMNVLGGKKDLDPSKNSFGLALLIEDSDDKVTRRYRRLIPTQFGNLPSFPWAVVKAYRNTLNEGQERLAKLQEGPDDLLIRYSGDPSGSHRVKLTANSVLNLSSNWPEASPFKGKIVLLGGSYLDQDRHDTPVGRLTGVEIIANVVETDLAGGGHSPPSKIVLFGLDLFEAFVLILVFHSMRIGMALFFSSLLAVFVAIACSKLAFGDWIHFWHFVPILLGLILFECYEHYRRTEIPHLFRMLFRKSNEN